eukprot:10744446-Lingulodinium_polyedra.AAC.1
MARRWEASQMEFKRQELWRRTIERLAARVEQLLARPASPATSPPPGLRSRIRSAPPWCSTRRAWTCRCRAP